jgi:EAL domain-containing protein (putative c-di-GMP-specific phosphodiesterase class I)/DNA-binding response OmpR family regulator
LHNIIQKLKIESESRSVLIIDDDRDVALSLARLLKKFFKECITASDGESGLDIFLTRFQNNNPFTLVITDLELPKIGGLRVISEIRDISKNLPILILSAHDESEFMAEAIRMDVQGYLLKPLVMVKLFERLDKIFINKNIMDMNSATQIDNVTGWKKYFALTNKINSTKLTPITILSIRINHLASMFNIIGKGLTNEYLSDLARTLEGLLFEADGEFYRTGKDELCLVLDGEQIEYATNLAKNMLSVTRYFYKYEQGIILNSTLSIGIAYGVENVLLQSKLALAKTNNHIGDIAFFSQIKGDKNHTFTDGRNILKMIFNAITEESVLPFLQPIADVNTRKFIIYQALMRIREDNQLYGPETFLHLAMGMGQMPIITRSMIRNTFKLYSTLPENAIISISLSFYDLNDEGLLSYISYWVERYNLSSSNIAFQIRNEIEILDNQYIFEVIQELKSRGYKIILDNFGLSQCNFLNLLELKPDFIKLQLDVIEKLQSDSHMVLIVHKIIEIAHAIGSKVIISNISNLDQFKLLNSANIDLMQGFAIRAPYEVLFE